MVMVLRILERREDDGHTHQWTVYVKPYRNEDMLAYVKKIQLY
jgi:YEATS domain-containing protein 4